MGLHKKDLLLTLGVCADVLGTGCQKKHSVAKQKKSRPLQKYTRLPYHTFQNKTMLKLKMPTTYNKRKIKIKQL